MSLKALWVASTQVNIEKLKMSTVLSAFTCHNSYETVNMQTCPF